MTALCCAAPLPAAAANSWPAGLRAATPSLMGPMGLITVPSARMEPAGTVRAQVSTAGPYAHAIAAVQLSDSFNVAVRQSAHMPSLRDDPVNLYPGIDMRLRLTPENAHMPEITIGMQSAIGHTRMSAEYLALSKRWNNFDVTGGMAWGRMGSKAHIDNPLKILGDHFDKKRALDGELPSGPQDWFTGPDVGLFAGVQYDTPQPWALGISYSPTSWANIGAGLIGGEKIMATLSLQGGLNHWFGRTYRSVDNKPLRNYRTGVTLPREMVKAADADGIILRDTHMNKQMVWTHMDADRFMPLPRQIGHAGRAIADHAGPYPEGIEVSPMIYGLRGPTVKFMRRDLEEALALNNGSPQEIWRNATISPDSDRDYYRAPRFRWGDMIRRMRYIWDTQTSLSEEDSGVLYRTGLVVETERPITGSLMAGGGVRINIADNLDHLNTLRPRALLPVREDIDIFTQNRIVVDRAYLGWFKTLKTDLHAMAAVGYLEEMYGGAGGELLYRPFGKTYAIGVEAWQVFKRDPYADMAQGFTGDSLLTGHINAWYEIPDTELTLHARFGRYLAEDVGGTLSLSRKFTHGGSVEAFATATNGADFDLFGGTTHIYSGLRLSLPLGNVKPLPRGSAMRMTVAQIGRQSGQSLDRPMPLYEVTEPFSLRRIAADWNSIAE